MAGGSWVMVWAAGAAPPPYQPGAPPRTRRLVGRRGRRRLDRGRADAAQRLGGEHLGGGRVATDGADRAVASDHGPGGVHAPGGGVPGAVLARHVAPRVG